MPTKAMLEQAEKLIREFDLDAVARLTDSEHVLSMLEEEEAKGALVAVARGNHAHIIKEKAGIPIAEIRLTGQELALLIRQAQRMCGHKNALIALVGFFNMFSDPEPIAQVLEANVRTYYAESSAAIPSIVECARRDGAEIIIGGKMAIEYAQGINMKAVFLDAASNSIRDAIFVARRILYGIEIERHKTTEFMALFNSSFDAIVKLDTQGQILIANYMAEKAFHMPMSKLIGGNIHSYMELGSESPLYRALNERKRIFAAIAKIGSNKYVANLATLENNGAFDGFILSLQEFERIDAMEEEIRVNRYMNEKRAHHTLREYTYPSECMRRLKDEAAAVAQYEMPILITGEYGTDKERLAESIHNAGVRRNQSFERLDLAMLTPAMQEKKLYASSGGAKMKSPFESAHMGTLLIENIDLLCSGAQLQLLNILKEKWLLNEDGSSALPVNCRIICTASEQLRLMAESGSFSRALYMEIARITLYMPSLSERKTDIDQMIDEYISQYSSKYKKFVSITPEAKARLISYPWPTNDLGFSYFLEKLVLFSENNTVDEADVIHMMDRQDPDSRKKSTRVPVIVANEEEARLIAALETYYGDRTRMAAALGISKTTLWRRLKKYRLLEGK